MSPYKPHRPAFTLIEVMLALGLTVIVLGVIYTAIDLNLRGLDTCRSGVEEALLARAVLHRIADDIRGAVPYDPLQSSQTMQVPVSAADLKKAMAASAASDLSSTGSSGSSSTGGSSSQTGSSSGTGGTGGSSGTSGSGTGTTSTDGTTSSTDNLAPAPVPGLYGETDWLQINVSRLPRLDQMMSNVNQSPDTFLIDRLSDLKTVKYYVISPYSAGGAAGPGGTSNGTGLVRIELDRAVASYQARNGGLDPASLNVQPLAPEVAAIQFQYFDGTELLDYWDSQGMGGLPWAIQVTLSILPPSTARRRLSPGSKPVRAPRPTMLTSSRSSAASWSTCRPPALRWPRAALRAAAIAPAAARAPAQAQARAHDGRHTMKRPSRRGMILVVVLVVISLCTMAAITFTQLMVAEREASDVAVRRAQARLAAESGLEMARMFLAQTPDVQKQNGGTYDNSIRFRRRVGGGQRGRAHPRTFHDHLSAGRKTAAIQGIRFGLEDESAKLNLNILASLDQKVPGCGREILMGLPGMTEEIADAILDWIDQDDELRDYGAELETYRCWIRLTPRRTGR